MQPGSCCLLFLPGCLLGSTSPPSPPCAHTRAPTSPHPRSHGLCTPELGLRSAENTVVVLHVRATVTGVLHVQCVIQEVQVLFRLGDVLCRVLLRVQDLWREWTHDSRPKAREETSAGKEEDTDTRSLPLAAPPAQSPQMLGQSPGDPGDGDTLQHVDAPSRVPGWHRCVPLWPPLKS